MRHMQVLVGVALSAALSINVYAASPEPTGSGDAAIWQHHQELIDYYGVTSSYTCTGIEDRMRELLKYLGARPDMKITPLCSSQSAPMQQVFVRVDFYSLAPASQGTADATAAHWVPLNIAPSDPLFRDRAECELFQNVKNLITKDFTVRDVRYTTTCTPNQTTLQDYKVTGEILAPPELQRASAR